MAFVVFRVVQSCSIVLLVFRSFSRFRFFSDFREFVNFVTEAVVSFG